LNPYGLKGVLFPFTLMTRFQKGNPFAESIGEFVSPFVLRLSDAYPFYPHWPVWTFRILALLALLALIPLLKQRKYWAVLLCLAFFPLAGKMIRNIPLLVIVALPAIAWAMPVSGLWRFGGLRHASARHARLAVLGIAGALTVVLGLRVVTNAYYISTRRADRFGLGWNRLAVPVDAASYINRVGLRGPMLNHLNLGGYLMWAQSARVFIDGRLEVVGEELYERYREVTSSAEDLKRATDHYGFQFAVFPYAVSPRFLGQLSLDPSWRLAYVDALVTVFVERVSARWTGCRSRGGRPPRWVHVRCRVWEGRLAAPRSSVGCRAFSCGKGSLQRNTTWGCSTIFGRIFHRPRRGFGQRWQTAERPTTRST
jgi:hypothetical protein